MQYNHLSKEELLIEVDKLKVKVAEFEKSENVRLSAKQTPKQTENQLLQGEKKYKDLFEKSQDAILIIENGKFVDCNNATIKMLHFNKKAEFLNTHPSELSPEKQPDGKMSFSKADEMMEIALKNGSHRFEWDHKKSDGEIFPVEVLLTVIENTENLQIIHTVWRDISERRQFENTIKESEEKLRAVFENSTNLYFSHTTDHIITYLSPQVENILGYTQQEAMIKWTELASDNPINEIGFENTVRAIETGERQAPYELELVRKNGEKVWVEVREAPIVENGKTISIVGSLTDITERKQAEQELRRSEKRFKRLFDDLGDSVFVTRIGETDMGEIIEVNAAAVKQTGYSREELLKMNIVFDLCVAGTGKISTDDWNEKLHKGEKVTNIEKKRRKDGSEFWTEVIVTPIEFNGEIVSLSINHDITIRKKAEDDLRDSEEHFRTMFENASIGFYRTTPEGEILYANAALIAMLGYKDFDELANLNLKNYSFDIVNQRSEILDMINQQGYSKGYESKWKVKDNRIIFIRENTKAYSNQAGKVIYYEGTIEDITEEKQAELLLKESEEKYRTLIDNIQDGVFIIDEGKIIFANDALAAIIGYTIDDILDEDFTKFIAPEDVDKLMNNYIKGMKEESGANEYEFRVLHNDESTQVYVNITVDKINYENKPVAFGTVKDISENKKMQELLSIREKYYRALFNLSPTGIIVIDNKGFILDINDSFCKYNGYTPAELKGANISILVPEEKQKEMDLHIKEIIKGKSLREEVINISKDGSPRNIELYETKVTLTNGQLGILSIANDITERTRTAQIQSVL
jgi:PAS domain S-box-containing protein